MKDVKPKYCTDRDLDCEECENFDKDDKFCLLLEEMVRLLDDVINKRVSGGNSQS